jgi:hypothetical protein
MASELKIFTPIGMVGYGYSTDIFWSTVEGGVDAIIVDSGSTDSGPSKLATRKGIQTNEAYDQDLAPFVAACHHYRVPVLIGKCPHINHNYHL